MVTIFHPITQFQRDFAMPQADPKINSNWTILFICWFLASVSTLGSLFFSRVMEFAPCLLCWYQRICLFPLVVILAVGLFPFDKSVVKYALPLAIAGWLTALYHSLLYSGIIPESIQRWPWLFEQPYPFYKWITPSLVMLPLSVAMC